MFTLGEMKEAFRGNENVRFREEVVGGRSITIVCYMLSDDDLWKLPLGTETRGAAFDTETGELMCLPFEKFFNVNEKPHTQAKNVQDLMNMHMPEVVEKMDGSMINAVRVNGEIYLKTKKSFTSDVALLAQSAMTDNVRDLCNYFLDENVTPIFEFTSPDNKIVIDYGNEPQFTLIAGRCMETGEYLTQMALDSQAHRFGLRRPRWHYAHDLKSLMESCDTAEDIEGWVIYVGGHRFKVKTQWYINRHRLIDIRERDIAEFVLAETLDDMIPNLLECGADMDVVRGIEHKIAQDLAELRAVINAASEAASRVPDGKERAEFVNGNYKEIAGFVFRQSRGQEVSDESLKDWYARKNLSSFSLKSIGNPNFRKVGESDE